MATTMQAQHEALKRNGWSIHADPDQSGRFYYKDGNGEGSDISFDSEGAALVAAITALQGDDGTDCTVEQQQAVLQEMAIRINRDSEPEGRWFWYPDGGEMSQRYDSEADAIRAAYAALPDQQYRLDVDWRMGGWMNICAKSPKQAQQIAIEHAALPDGDYMEGSFTVNEVATV